MTGCQIARKNNRKLHNHTHTSYSTLLYSSSSYNRVVQSVDANLPRFHLSRFEEVEQAMSDFKDKVIVLTGGSSGMGRSFVSHILSKGAFLSFGDINASLAQSLLLQIHSSAPRLVSRLLFTKTDIRDPLQVRHLFARTIQVFGKVDVLLCVAGVNVPDSFLPSPARLDAPNLLNIQVNLSGTVNTVYAGLPHLTSDAKIIIISSAAGIYPSSVQPLYSASKHGLIGFARALAPILIESQKIMVLAPSTYLPPSQPNSLNMSTAMTENEDDVFRKVIDETLGFVEMSTIIKTLSGLLENGENGQVVEVLPDRVETVPFRQAPEKLESMERILRDTLCRNECDKQVDEQSIVKVKDEDMAG